MTDDERRQRRVLRTVITRLDRVVELLMSIEDPDGNDVPLARLTDEACALLGRIQEHYELLAGRRLEVAWSDGMKRQPCAGTASERHQWQWVSGEYQVCRACGRTMADVLAGQGEEAPQ